MFHTPAYSTKIPQQCTTATHTEAGVLLVVFHPCLTTKCSFGGRQASRQPSDASTPQKNCGSHIENKLVTGDFSAQISCTRDSWEEFMGPEGTKHLLDNSN